MSDNASPFNKDKIKSVIQKAYRKSYAKNLSYNQIEKFQRKQLKFDPIGQLKCSFLQSILASRDNFVSSDGAKKISNDIGIIKGNSKFYLKTPKSINVQKPIVLEEVKHEKDEHGDLVYKIPWLNITFKRENISFNILDKNYTSHYLISRESFNSIKKSLNCLNIAPLAILLRNGRATITNPDVLESVVQILYVKEWYKFNINQTNVKRKIDFNSTAFEYETICRIYQLYKKSDFFDGLIKGLPYKKLKIIPVDELILDEKFLKTKVDESFLLLYEIQNYVIIIWESVRESKATYIFQAPFSNFQSHTQQLFEFICNSEIRNKRDELLGNRKLRVDLGFVKRILHENPVVWIQEIKGFFLNSF